MASGSSLRSSTIPGLTRISADAVQREICIGPSRTRPPAPGNCSKKPWIHSGRVSCKQLSTSSGATSSHSLAFPSHLSRPSPYDIFSLSRSSSTPEIKERYYELVKTLHPDRRLNYLREQRQDSPSKTLKGKGKAKAASQAFNDAEEERIKEEFRLVVKAYELLTDRKRKAAYDQFGIGWDLGSSSSSPGNPFEASAAELSELRRRAAFMQGRQSSGAFHGWNSQAGHDFSGWQREAGSGSSFYAHSAGPRSGSNFSFDSNFRPGSSRTRYASNKRFISGVALITWTLALFQFHRLSQQSSQAVALADKRHLDAVKNLHEARVSARSFEGREKLEALRRRARESQTLREVEGGVTKGSGEENVRLIEAPAAQPWGVGHGGPSGRAEHDRRMQEAEKKMGRNNNEPV